MYIDIYFKLGFTCHPKQVHIQLCFNRKSVKGIHILLLLLRRWRIGKYIYIMVLQRALLLFYICIVLWNKMYVYVRVKYCIEV